MKTEAEAEVTKLYVKCQELPTTSNAGGELWTQLSSETAWGTQDCLQTSSLQKAKELLFKAHSLWHFAKVVRTLTKLLQRDEY